MGEYILAVFAVLILTSAIIVYILKRYKLLDISMVVSVAASSLILSLSFPFFSGIFGAFAIFFTIIAYVVVAFILSVIISSFINDANIKRFIDRVFKSGDVKKSAESGEAGKKGLFDGRKKTGTWRKTDGGSLKRPEGDHKEYESHEVASGGEEAAAANNVELNEKKSGSEEEAEKFVDSGQIIDTMGIETGANAEKPIQSFIRIPKTAISDQIVMIDDSDQDSDEVTWVSLDDDDIPPEITEYIKAAEEGSQTTKEREQAAEELQAAEERAQEQVASGPEKKIEELIDRAFDLKKKCRCEEAVAEYMNILSMNPDNELTFSVVLDICVLYKDLGLKELARDILQNYLEQYGNEMDEVTKNQIKINLSELDNANVS